MQASPRDGEKWARHWMDVVRFAEDDYNVSGTNRAEYKFAYTYRDWLIKAFNDYMPYDMFVRSQLAGDQLDEKVRDKAVPGLGMHGLGVWHMTNMAPSWRGAPFSASYWFSKSIDLGSNGQTETGFQSDMKGLSNFDQPHGLLLLGAWDIGARGGSSWLRRLSRRWTLTSVLLLKSGTPFTVDSGSDSAGFGNLDGTNGDRPNILDPAILGRTIGNPDTSVGLLPRSAFGYFQAPAQLALPRDWSMVLSAEAINLSNTPAVRRAGKEPQLTQLRPDQQHTQRRPHLPLYPPHDTVTDLCDTLSAVPPRWEVAMRHSISLLLAGLCAVASAETTAEPIAIFLGTERVSDFVLAEMRREVESVTQRSGIRFSWRALNAPREAADYSGVVVIRLVGDCSGFDAAPATAGFPKILGSTHVSDGQVLPFADVFCDRVLQVIRPSLVGVDRDEKERLLGRALGRVLSHELHHILANTTRHEAAGVAKSTQNRQELTLGGSGR